MIILAFDTSAACSAAVWRGNRVVAHRLEERSRGHAEALFPMLSAVLAEAGLSYADVAAFAVAHGPGTFAGLRVGVAAARGLGLATARRVVGISGLEALAAGARADAGGRGYLLPVLDARRGQVYAQAFGGDLEPLGDPYVSDVRGLAERVPAGPAVTIGSGAAAAAGALRDAGREVAMALPDARVDARWVAERAAARLRTGAAATPVRPLYLRPPGAAEPAPRRRA